MKIYKHKNIAAAALGLLLASCSMEQIDLPGGFTGNEKTEIQLSFISDAADKLTRSALYEDTAPQDLNLFIWRDGVCVGHKFIDKGLESINLSLVKGDYSFYALAGCGKKVGPDDAGWTEDESKFRDMMVEAIGAENRFMMAGAVTHASVSEARTAVGIILERLVSKITLSYIPDMALSGSGIQVTSVRLCDAANKVRPFAPEFMAYEDEVSTGDYASEEDLARLNAGGSMELFAYENCWGNLLTGNDDPQKKVPEEINGVVGPTYIEVGCSFADGKLLSGELTYRIYLGSDATSNFDLCRNSSYRVILYGSKDGLDEVSWRIDKDVNVNGALATAQLTRCRHSMEELYVGEMIEGEITDIDPSVTAYFGGSLQSIVDNACLRFISDESPDAEDDPVAVKFKGASSDKIRFCGTCRKSSVFSGLWLCLKDGTPLTQICDGASVTVPSAVLSFSRTADTPEPVDEAHYAMINGGTSSVYTYLCDKNGVNLLSDRWEGYGFDSEVFSPTLENNFDKWSNAAGMGSLTSRIEDEYLTGDNEENQPFCTLTLQVTNTGKDPAVNKELWMLVEDQTPIKLRFRDSIHGITASEGFDVDYIPLELCCYDKAYGGRTLASQYGVSENFFVTIKNPSKMSFVMRYMAVTQRGAGQNPSAPAAPSGLYMYRFNPPSSLKIPQSLYLTYSELSQYSTADLNNKSCSAKVRSDGTTVVGITRSLDDLLEAVQAAEGRYCYNNYGYYSSDLSYWDRSFHIKNGMSILVDLATPDGKYLSYDGSENLENGGQEAATIYSGDYDFRTVRFYTAGGYKGYAYSSGFPLSSYTDLNPFKMSQILARSREIAVNMVNSSPTRPYFTMLNTPGPLTNPMGTLKGTAISAEHLCDGFCRTHARGTKRDPVDYTTSQSATAKTSNTAPGTYTFSQGMIADLFLGIFNTTFTDSYNWYGSANNWQHHAHPTKLTLSMTFSESYSGAASAGNWQIFNFKKYNPVSLTYDNSGYVAEDSNPYTVVTAVDWKKTHESFTNLIVLLQ